MPTTIVGKHITCGYSISTLWTFDVIENRHDVYRGEGCVKKFCESLREHTMKIINFKKKKVMPSINKECKSYLNQASCHTGKKKFENKCTNDKIYCRVRDHCHYPGKCEGAGHSICNSKYSIPNYDLGFECNFHFLQMPYFGHGLTISA